MPKAVTELKSTLSESISEISRNYIGATNLDIIEKGKKSRVTLVNTARDTLTGTLNELLNSDTEYQRATHKTLVATRLDDSLNKLINNLMGEQLVDKLFDETMRKQIAINREQAAINREQAAIASIKSGDSLRPDSHITDKKRGREDDAKTPDAKRVKLSKIDTELLMSFSGFRKSTLKVILENEHMDALNQSTDTDIKDKRKAYNVITAFLDLRNSTLDDTDNFKKLQIFTHELFSGSEGEVFYNQLLEIVAKLKPALLVNTDSADTDVQVSSTLGFS